MIPKMLFRAHNLCCCLGIHEEISNHEHESKVAAWCKVKVARVLDRLNMEAVSVPWVSVPWVFVRAVVALGYGVAGLAVTGLGIFALGYVAARLAPRELRGLSGEVVPSTRSTWGLSRGVSPSKAAESTAVGAHSGTQPSSVTGSQPESLPTAEGASSSSGVRAATGSGSAPSKPAFEPVAPTGVDVVLEGATGLRVTWTRPPGGTCVQCEVEVIALPWGVGHQGTPPRAAFDAAGPIATLTARAPPLVKAGRILPAFHVVRVRVRAQGVRWGGWSGPAFTYTTLPPCSLSTYSIDLSQRLAAQARALSKAAAPAGACPLSRTHHPPACVGRDRQLRQGLEALSRCDKPCVLVAAPPGVGKTALVQGLAELTLPASLVELPSASGSEAEADTAGSMFSALVPHTLVGAVLLQLDPAAVSAGCATAGEVEARVQELLVELRTWSSRVVLVVEDLHQHISGADGGPGITTLLVGPALRETGLPTRHPVRCVATCTTEGMAALTAHPSLVRCFMPLHLEEMAPRVAQDVVAARSRVLGSHYRVSVSRQAVEAAVDLTLRYLPSRKLPDKALDALDLACAARVAATTDHGATPTPGGGAVCACGQHHPEVTDSDVAKVLAQWTGIPSTRLADSTAHWLSQLASRLAK